MAVSRHIRTVFAISAISMSGMPASAETVLENVLRLLTRFDEAPLTGFFGNIAANAGGLETSPRQLRALDQVVYGYDALGTPLVGTAGPSGLVVTPVMARDAATGLTAGIYPVGSALYDLPPAGQLSLLKEAQDGAALRQATETLLSRVDGSITTVIVGLRFPDLVPNSLVPVLRQVAINQIVPDFTAGPLTTTALGAVNAGQVVTNVVVTLGDTVPNGTTLADHMGQIAAGASASMQVASAGAVRAVQSTMTGMAGQPGGRAILLDLASNQTEVIGRVDLVIEGANASVADIATTVLGAVNSGSVRGMP